MSIHSADHDAHGEAIVGNEAVIVGNDRLLVDGLGLECQRVGESKTLLGGLAALHLTLDAVVYSIKDVVDGRPRLVGRLSAILVYASLDENRVPLLLGFGVHSVGAADVTLGGVADKVDSLGRL